jgi:hypothetical protein
MKTSLLIIIVFSLVLFPAVTKSFAEESFSGTSSFENVPAEISRHFPSTFDVRLQYTC